MMNKTKLKEWLKMFAIILVIELLSNIAMYYGIEKVFTNTLLGILFTSLIPAVIIKLSLDFAE